MRYINKIDDFLAKFEKGLVVLIFSSLILIMTVNITSRNLFQVAFREMLEITPALVLWLALFGSTLALKKQRHIKLELLLRFCSERVNFIADIASNAFGLAVMGILFLASVEFLKNEIDIFGWVGIFSIIFPLFFSLSFFRYFTGIVNRCRYPAGSNASSEPVIDEAKK